MPRGRPGKLTPELQARLCLAIADGNYYEAACRAAGIGYNTFRAWMRRGKRARQGKYRAFREAVLGAEAAAEAAVVQQWRAQIPENWQAARDFLARRFPSRWGPKDKHEVTGKDGGPLLGSLEDMVAALQQAKRNGPTPEANGHAAPGNGYARGSGPLPG